MEIAQPICTLIEEFSGSMDLYMFWAREPYEIPCIYALSYTSLSACRYYVCKNSSSFGTTLYSHVHLGRLEGRLGRDPKS